MLLLVELFIVLSSFICQNSKLYQSPIKRLFSGNKIKKEKRSNTSFYSYIFCLEIVILKGGANKFLFIYQTSKQIFAYLSNEQ